MLSFFIIGLLGSGNMKQHHGLHAVDHFAVVSIAVEIPKMQQGEEEEQGVATPPPPLPPRASKVLKEMNVENSPPLPPRNPMASLSVNLDAVVPITPPARGHSPGEKK